jgi:hypothetical protein
MNTYIGVKIIEAEPMDRNTYLESKGQPFEPANMDGYKVRYPDGYESWSPKAVFEEAYVQITVGEDRKVQKEVVKKDTDGITTAIVFDMRWYRAA